MIKYIVAIVLQILVLIFAFPMIHSGFKVSSDWKDALFIVVIFAVLNFIFRKLIVIFTLGIGLIFYYLTLGIAGLVLNAIILILIGKLFPSMLSVPGFFPAFIGGFLLTLVNYFVGTGKDSDD